MRNWEGELLFWEGKPSGYTMAEFEEWGHAYNTAYDLAQERCDKADILFLKKDKL